jgi:hypothetical protein
MKGEASYSCFDKRRLICKTTNQGLRTVNGKKDLPPYLASPVRESPTRNNGNANWESSCAEYSIGIFIVVA